MKLSFTLGGGLGDYILNYLGDPGNRLAYIMMAVQDIEFRVSAQCPAGIDLVKNSPYFKFQHVYQEKKFAQNRLKDDISNIGNLAEYLKVIPPLWLSSEEEDILVNVVRPYAVFHPFASHGPRNLTAAFNTTNMVQWIADASGINVVVLGQEDFGYESANVRHIKGSPRLATKLVEHSSFFVGSHSSMQCAAWVHDIPSFCIGPSHLLFHNLYSPSNNDLYLKPLFKGKNIFMMYDQADRFSYFLDYFLRTATSLQPQRTPEECRRRIALSGMASELLLTSDKQSC